MFRLEITDGLSSCGGCDGYVDSATDVFLAFITPDHSLDDWLRGRHERGRVLELPPGSEDLPYEVLGDPR